jgi:hypothetical protein
VLEDAVRAVAEPHEEENERQQSGVARGLAE